MDSQHIYDSRTNEELFTAESIAQNGLIQASLSCILTVQRVCIAKFELKVSQMVGGHLLNKYYL